jgi:hypothetical protein
MRGQKDIVLLGLLENIADRDIRQIRQIEARPVTSGVAGCQI